MATVLDETLIEVQTVKQTADRGVFAVGPLPAGFGHTLGNTLRRVLLSSLTGAALSQVRFTGVSHQFSTIRGVKEDVVELTLNLKKVRLKLEGDQPTALTLSAQGPGEFKAGDLEVPAGVKVVNPDLTLATLADKKTKLEAELMLQPGQGYRGVEEGSSKVGVIPLDCLFSPVLHVRYTVSPTRVGRSTDWEMLEIEITTDKTITPLEGLTEASRILTSFFGRVSLGEKAKRKEARPQKHLLGDRKDQDPIEELELPLRILNTLKKAKITTIGELLGREEAGLLKIKNIGEASLKEIERVLVKEGLR